MIEVTQSILGDKGNCFAACLASIFEIPLEDAFDVNSPNVTENNWVRELNKWLRKYDLIYVIIHEPSLYKSRHRKQFGYHIIQGENHATVGYNGKIVFDPSPNSKRKMKIGSYGIFVKRFEAKK